MAKGDQSRNNIGGTSPPQMNGMNQGQMNQDFLSQMRMNTMIPQKPWMNPPMQQGRALGGGFNPNPVSSPAMPSPMSQFPPIIGSGGMARSMVYTPEDEERDRKYPNPNPQYGPANQY